MKILIIESDKEHCQSAKETLSSHDLIIIRSYYEAIDVMKEKATIPFNFDVVLTDMMIKDKDDNDGIERIYGFIVALKAVQCGAKHVAMIACNDAVFYGNQVKMSHALWNLQRKNLGKSYDDKFIINGSTVGFINFPLIKNKNGWDTIDWANVLEWLISNG